MQCLVLGDIRGQRARLLRPMAGARAATKRLVGLSHGHALPTYVLSKALVGKTWPAFLYGMVPLVHHPEAEHLTHELEREVAQNIFQVAPSAGVAPALLGELG